MATNTRFMTADELFAMPADNLRHELVQGELRTMTPSGGAHGGIAMEIAGRLWAYLQSHRIGKVIGADAGFLISRNPDTVLAPDVAFLSNDRIPPDGLPKNFVPLAPDLVVEVRSPGDTHREVRDKTALWLQCGVRLVWVVDPEALSVSVHRADAPAVILHGDEVLDGRDVLPDFQCRVGDLFE